MTAFRVGLAGTERTKSAAIIDSRSLGRGAVPLENSTTDPTQLGDHPSVLPNGAKIGGDRYTVIRVLGAGGMGTVYLCEQAHPRREVVIKFPHPALMSQEGFRERFAAEIQFMISLDHPGIASIYETGEHRGLPFAVLQYLTGGSLGDRLSQLGRPQTVEEVQEWLLPVAATLDSIHEDGVLHRDIKPDNILFDRRGHVFLSDFGISKAIAEISSPSVTFTRTGIFVGSPKYAPPEYIDRTFSPAGDQYSLAAVVYLAVTGHPPHQANTAERLLVEKATLIPKLASEYSEGLPAVAVTALERALFIDPDDRYSSCREFAAEVTQAVESELRSRGKRDSAIVAIGLLVVALVLLVVRPWSETHVTQAPTSVQIPTSAPINQIEPVAVAEPVSEPEPIAPEKIAVPAPRNLVIRSNVIDAEKEKKRQEIEGWGNTVTPPTRSPTAVCPAGSDWNGYECQAASAVVPTGAAIHDVRLGTNPDFARLVIELSVPAGYSLEHNEWKPGKLELVLSIAATAHAIQKDSIRNTFVESYEVVPNGERSKVRVRLAAEGKFAVKEMLLANPPRIVLDILPLRGSRVSK